MNNIIVFLVSISFIFSNYNQFNQAFIDVSKEQSPAIVSIISEKIEKVNNMFFFNPFEDFGFEQDPYQQERKAQSLGSGVIINKYEGYIITNNHVIEGAEEIKVVLFDKREVSATIVATDPLSDIAVIQIDSDNLQEVNPGNSTNLQIGEWVIAIGSPFGLHLNHTVTAGIVSATGRSDVISKLNFENFIQHDAAINPGNSGGPLLNSLGQLIGVNTAIYSPSGASSGIGFAIPVNTVKRIVPELIAYGRVQTPILGITPIPQPDYYRQLWGIEGVIVLDVIEGSDPQRLGMRGLQRAQRGQIQLGDVIVEIAGQAVGDEDDFANIMEQHKPGDVVTVKTLRDNRRLEYDIQLQAPITR